jgi:hypothetical protein
MRRLLLTAVALAAVLSPTPGYAWGNEGHQIIAAIARDQLTAKAKAWVDAILAQDTDTLTAPDMISRATWADRWRDSGHRDTASWHFVDQELQKPDLQSACFNFPNPSDPRSAGPAQDCVVDKINEFQAELSDPATPQAERLLALKYLLHFVGDIHQPLHASDNQDRGGNCIPVSLGGQRTTNLHSYWDTGVLSGLGTDPIVAAQKLEAEITPSQRQAWAAGTAKSWAQESYAVAKAAAYTIKSPSGCENDRAPTDLSAAYQKKALAVAEEQLEKASIRLAWVLNNAAAAAGAAS